MAKLSLNARKNIKEYEKSQEENLKKIEDASGIRFETEFDWLSFVELSEKGGYKERFGEILYAWYLGALAEQIVTFCKDPIQKEAFVETFGAAKKITFELYDHQKGDPGYYSRTRNDNGTLMMGASKTNFCCGSHEMGKDLSVTCSGNSAIPVAARKNIQDSDKHRVTNMGKISKAVGLEFSFEIEWEPFVKAAPANWVNRIGELIYESYLGSLAWNLESLCKDDMSKEALAEACEKKILRFVLAPADTKGYFTCTFDDGILTANIAPANFASNVQELGNDIASRL